MKKLIRNILASWGYEIRPVLKNKRDDPYAEQILLLSQLRNPLIFDVGANVGNMVEKYHQIFPGAKIHAFEPFDESFQRLKAKCEAFQGVTLNQLGVADKSGSRKFHANKVASTNSLLPASRDAFATKGGERFETKELVEIEITTLDRYAAEKNIAQIDLLKLDVQGAEPQVLQGASGLISAGAIKVIFTEIMVTHFYEGQQSLHEALSMYNSLGFKLYNFYDISAFEGPLRQLDAIFVRKAF
jgi:FkbM family methyltransferase